MADINSSSIVSYKMDSDLALMLDEYQVWFLKFLTYFLYPQETQALYDGTVLDRMELWLENAKHTHFSDNSLRQVAAVHSEFKRKSTHYIQKFFDHQVIVPYEGYLELVSLFEEFIVLVRRMDSERRVNQAESGDVPYLRPAAFLNSDLKRELDRLARNGKPFCLVYVRFVHSDGSEDVAPFLRKPEMLKMISHVFHDALRSYDDAYKVSNSDLVLSLKQIEAFDALSTMERLARSVEGRSGEFKTEDGGTFQISLSYQVLQQEPDEDPDKILDLLKENLDAHAGTTKKIFSYREMSSLQKFVQDQIAIEHAQLVERAESSSDIENSEGVADE